MISWGKRKKQNGLPEGFLASKVLLLGPHICLAIFDLDALRFDVLFPLFLLRKELQGTMRKGTHKAEGSSQVQYVSSSEKNCEERVF